MGNIGASGVVWVLLPVIIGILKNKLGGTNPFSFSGEQDSHKLIGASAF
jgi:hypothetical protein